MTPAQKKLIRTMRECGMACTAIAKQLGLSPNTVKSFCRREGIRVKTSASSAQSANHNVNVTITFCESCSAPVAQIPGRKKKRFCSDQCRMDWWARHRSFIDQRTEHQLICEACGKEFSVYGVKHRKFCSRACVLASRRKAEKQ